MTETCPVCMKEMGSMYQLAQHICSLHSRFPKSNSCFCGKTFRYMSSFFAQSDDCVALEEHLREMDLKAHYVQTVLLRSKV